MTDYSKIEENAKRIGNLSTSNAIAGACSWLAGHFEEFEKIRDGEGSYGVIQEILSLGLRELQAIRAQIADEEERERSEKDCLWEVGA